MANTPMNGISMRMVAKARSDALTPLRIAVLEPDPASRAQLRAALSTAHRVIEVESTAALGELLASDKPVDLLVVALPPSQSESFELLSAIEQFPRRAPMLGIAAKIDDSSLDVLVRRALDDVVLKPFDAETMRARVRMLGSRSHLGGQFGPTMRVLRTAIARKESGEMIVRSRRGVARVYIGDGDLAWVQCPWDPVDIDRALRSAGVTADREELAAIVDEARRTNTSLAVVIANWGLADAGVIEKALSAELRRVIEVIVEDQSSISMLVPARFRESGTGARVGGDELVRNELKTIYPTASQSSQPPAPDTSRTEAFATHMLGTNGAETMGLVRLDRKSVRWLTKAEQSNDIVWMMIPLALVSAEIDEDLREVVLVRGDTAYAMWRPMGEQVAVFGRFSLSLTTVGMILSSGRVAHRLASER